jgi:hypothetical protein
MIHIFPHSHLSITSRWSKWSKGVFELYLNILRSVTGNEEHTMSGILFSPQSYFLYNDTDNPSGKHWILISFPETVMFAVYAQIFPLQSHFLRMFR